MRPAHVVEIVTPQKILLNGLWFGPKKPKRVIVWVHGLTSTAFSKLDIVEQLVDSKTAVLAFNNRGHDNVARMRRVSGEKSLLAGGGFERFEDCVDDIQGAVNFAKKVGAKDVYLAGQSTGCQKITYFASKKGRNIRGIILLAPISDYAAMVMKYGLPKIRHMQAIAKSMLKSGKENEFVRSKFWTDEPDSPRRFLSLYSPDSVEQSIFSYFDPKRRAKILSSIRIPLFAVLAEKDEYADRPAEEIVLWIEKNTKCSLTSLIAKGATHGFKGYEKQTAKAISRWILSQK